MTYSKKIELPSGLQRGWLCWIRQSGARTKERRRKQTSAHNLKAQPTRDVSRNADHSRRQAHTALDSSFRPLIQLFPRLSETISLQLSAILY